MLTLLPVDVIYLIFAELTTSSFARVTRTCKRFASLSNNESIWRFIANKDFEVNMKVIESAGRILMVLY